MNRLEKKIEKKLIKRKEDGLYRELKDYSGLIDFASNDYLGLAKNGEFSEGVPSGATGSRMISGNNEGIEKLEKEIAEYHGYESALLFNSGYTANLGVISTIPQRGDTIIYDELIHASIRDGIRLSNANSYAFLHNDLENLALKLQRGKGNVFVVVESVYSMDGDSPEMVELSKICKIYGAYLIVDEAHAIGIVGEKGEGLVGKLNLQKEVFCTVVTFGKALGCHGAAVLCSNLVKRYLVNFCRSFIYTTAPSPQTIQTIRNQYAGIFESQKLNEKSLHLKNKFIEEVEKLYELNFGDFGNIVSVFLPGNEKAKDVAKELEDAGYFVKAILSPTVQEGKERLRFCFHSFNTEEEVKGVISVLKNIKD